MLTIIPLLLEGNRGMKLKNQDFEKLQYEASSLIKNYFNIENLDEKRVRITPRNLKHVKNGVCKTPHSGVKVAHPIEQGREDTIFVLIKQFEFDEPQTMDIFGEHQGGFIIVSLVGTDVNKFSLQDSMNSVLYHELVHAMDPNLEMGDDKRIQKGIELEKSTFNRALQQGINPDQAKQIAKQERTKAAQAQAEKEAQLGEKQYYNKKIEVTAHLNQIIYELERVRKHSPEIIDAAIAERNFDQILDRIYDWEIMAKHLSPKNLKNMKRTIINVMINNSSANIQSMRLRDFF
jgi:hypothetical protein